MRIPNFKSISSNCYGTPTSVTAVDERIRELVQYRRRLARTCNEQINVRAHRFSLAHPNDRLLSVCIVITDVEGSEEEEQFVVYPNKIG